MSLNIDFGRRLRKAREKLGATREELAARAGIDPFRLKKIELGELDQSDLTRIELQRLAEALRSSATWLVDGEELEVPQFRAGSIAERSVGGAVQGALDFGVNTCPDCYHPIQGTRCAHCGRSPE